MIRLLVAAALGLLVGVVVVLLARRRIRRLLFAVLLEQGRREASSPTPYRHDQRVAAVQNRLSRHIGRRAYSRRWLKRILRGLE